MKLVLLLFAMAIASASAQGQCKLKKILYKPFPPTSSLGDDKVDTDITCPKGTSSLIATDWTQNFNDLADELLEDFIFPGLSGDWKDTYDCGAPGIKKAFMKGIAGCIDKKKRFHGQACINYVCNQQARTRNLCIDGYMQLKGKC
jgi:hypothetical protein